MNTPPKAHAEWFSTISIPVPGEPDGPLTDTPPTATRHQLLALISQWMQRASSSFRSASMEPKGIERQCIEHAGKCYWNCARELQELIDPPRDLPL